MKLHFHFGDFHGELSVGKDKGAKPGNFWETLDRLAGADEEEAEHDEETCMVEDCARCDIVELKEQIERLQVKHQAEAKRWADGTVRLNERIADETRRAIAAHEEMRAYKQKNLSAEMLEANKALVAENERMKLGALDKRFENGAKLNDLREELAKAKAEIARLTRAAGGVAA